ncbi:tail fiber protein [Moorena sp. SIO4G3]|uniref:tail fiber protein n=1 Tax=Moorena sp. SIO4G3 TaxID=2607821 RepID=UPI00142BEFDA|nr:tail fiber protein [Moorena sp. SIO4G3]NEO79489.1 tail fiber protein [Moorena sp. SIO4G3]
MQIEKTPLLLRGGSVGIGKEPKEEKLEVNGRIKEEKGLVIPVGTIVPYGGDTEPEGWLICDGSEREKVGEYEALYAVIKGLYGETSNKGKFKLPDLRHRVAVGYHEYFDRCKRLGEADGELKKRLKKEHVPPHIHQIKPDDHKHSIGFINPNEKENYHIHERGDVIAVSSDMDTGWHFLEIASHVGDNSLSADTIKQKRYEKDDQECHGETTADHDGSHGEEYGEEFYLLPPYLTVNYIIKY